MRLLLSSFWSILDYQRQLSRLRRLPARLVIGTLAAYSLARFRLPYNLDNKLSLWILVDANVSGDRHRRCHLFLMMRDLRLLNTSASHSLSSIPLSIFHLLCG